jgi:carbon-monoxide dehydrogenase medium subunit
LTPRKFDYFAPKTIAEAVELLSTREEAKVLAGGQSLIPLMKLRIASPRCLIDITKVPGLSYINKTDNDGLAIGSLTTHDKIENSDLIRKYCPILSEAASNIGDQQIRNKGTIGGSICHADPAGEFPYTILAVEAEIVAQGSNGCRVVKADEFFKDVFTTALANEEILTEIRIPSLPPRTGTAYLKLSRRAGDFAIVGVAALVTLGSQDICKRVRITLGAVGPKPLRAVDAERTLLGKAVEEKLILEAASVASHGTDPPSDIHGSADYRKAMIGEMVKRALNLAISRARGEVSRLSLSK